MVSKELSRIFDELERKAIGFNRVLPRITHDLDVTYPPFNIVKGENGKYTVEMALAGYSKDDISISQSGHFITVEGSKEEDSKDYLFQGIAARKFTRRIPASGVEVQSAEMKDGILSIVLNDKEAAVKAIPVS